MIVVNTLIHEHDQTCTRYRRICNSPVQRLKVILLCISVAL